MYIRALSFLLLLSCCTKWCLSAPGDNWVLVWNEEFEGNSVNRDKWTYEEHCRPQNSELQCYTTNSKNSRVENGHLVINVLNEKMGNKQFTSARLNTKCDPEGSFLRGRFEMRAMLPRAKHLWPAFWLIPQDQVYGGWPKSGEIDIMEYRGQETSKMSSALHYGSPHSATNTGPMNFKGVDFSRSYHTFVLEWDEKTMKWFVDGNNTFTVGVDKMWGSIYKAKGQPWDQRFHIIINVAVGGNFFGGYPPLTEQDVKKWEKPTMEVDYIRVYQKPNGNHKSSYSGIHKTCSADSDSGLTLTEAQQQGLIIGATVGGVVLIAVVVVLVFVIRRRRLNRDSMDYSSSSSGDSGKPLR